MNTSVGCILTYTVKCDQLFSCIGTIKETCAARPHLCRLLVFMRTSPSTLFFFLSSARLMQLGILVNNGAVTHTRCLSTKQAPTLFCWEWSLCSGAGPANGVHFHYHKTVHSQETNCLLGLAVCPSHLATFYHMLDLTTRAVYVFIKCVQVKTAGYVYWEWS